MVSLKSPFFDGLVCCNYNIAVLCFAMEIRLDVLSRCRLFEGVEASQIKGMLDCMRAYHKIYPKNGMVLSADEPATDIGILLAGGVNIVREDYWGNRAILSHTGPGELFGESFLYAGFENLPVSVICTEESAILFLNCRKIITTCSSSCAFHDRLIINMMGILASKNVGLTKKIGHITRRTIRERVLSYLSDQAIQARSNTVEIPFDRQELADYLSVDRSALSGELSKMQKDGLIRFTRNHFTLLNEEKN